MRRPFTPLSKPFEIVLRRRRAGRRGSRGSGRAMTFIIIAASRTGARHRPDMRQRALRRGRLERHAALRRLQAEQAGEGAGDAHRARAVGADGEVAHADRLGRHAAARRAARRAADLPRIVRWRRTGPSRSRPSSRIPARSSCRAAPCRPRAGAAPPAHRPSTARRRRWRGCPCAWACPWSAPCP